MINFGKSIDYATNNCAFSIYFSGQNQISVQIYDKDRRKANLMINNDMLRQSFMNIQELREHIYKQTIHQGCFKRQMFRLEQDVIFLNFTYPKCKVQTLSFSIKWQQPQQHTKSIEYIAKYIEQLSRNVEEKLKHVERQLEARMDRKLAIIISHLERKYNEISKKLEEQVQQKIQLASVRLQESQNINQTITKRCLQENCRKLIESNLRYFDEFRLIKTDLETSLKDCDLNIRELSNQVSNIRAFVLDHQDRTEDKVDKIKIDLSDLEKTVRFSFKHINDQLACLQALWSPQNANIITNQTTSQQQIPKIPQKTLANERKHDVKYVQKEQTTFIPILSEKALKTFLNEGTIFLEQ